MKKTFANVYRDKDSRAFITAEFYSLQSALDFVDHTGTSGTYIETIEITRPEKTHPCKYCGAELPLAGYDENCPKKPEKPYWQQRCEAAERVIGAYSDLQGQAYFKNTHQDWQQLKNNEPKINQ